MKQWLIRFLLRQLGYKPTREIQISITADASHALAAIEEVKNGLREVASLQNQIKK